jgi:energy-coupling factor transport system ATP-binding protein
VAERIRSTGRIIGSARAGSRLVPAPAGPAFIQIEHLTSGHPGGPDILHDVSVSVTRGESVALLGQNGSGKTSLAKHVVGLMKVRAGSVRVGGRPVAAYGMAELSREVGYVFQNPDHQIFSDTVAAEVGFGLRNRGLADGEIAGRVAEALAAVELAGREAEDPFALAKGERERLAVASLLAYRPAAIFFDEPTTGLDAREAQRMMTFIRALNAGGLTVILITHAMWAAAEFAARTVVLSGGRIVLDGPTREVFARRGELTRLALAPPPAADLAGRLGLDALTLPELLAGLEQD